MTTISQIEDALDGLDRAGFHIGFPHPFPCSLVSANTLGFDNSNPSGYLNDEVIMTLLYHLLNDQISDFLCVDSIEIILISCAMTCHYSSKEDTSILKDRAKYLRGPRFGPKRTKLPPRVMLERDTILLIPTHSNGNHWFATVLYYQLVNNTMFEFVFNSLSTGTTVPVVKQVFMQYITDDLPQKNKMKWQSSIIPCVQQPNGYDCGVMTIGNFTLELKFLFYYITRTSKTKSSIYYTSHVFTNINFFHLEFFIRYVNNLRMEDLDVWQFSAKEYVKNLVTIMNFPVDNVFLLRKRVEYVNILLFVYTNNTNTELVEDTAKSLPEVSNITNGIGKKFIIIPHDLTYDSDHDVNDNPILKVNRETKKRIEPQLDVHIKFYDATIPVDVLETSHGSKDMARDALIAYCASIGFSAKRYKVKGNYHLYGCDYGDLSRGAIRNTTRNTPGKNRCCPWR
jgi:hypothetical protein